MPLQAVVTKYLPPTDRRGARVKAYCQRGAHTISWNHTLDSDDNHRAAILHLLRKFTQEDRAKYGPSEGSVWMRAWAIGVLPDGGHVAVPMRSTAINPADVCDGDA